MIIVFSCNLWASDSLARYEVLPGQLHKGGKILVSILPVIDKFKVRMDYQIKTKEWVPVPAKLLKGKTEMEFPPEFKNEKGYKKLEKSKKMDIPKAQLIFVRKGDYGKLKNAYFLQVHPTNKKTKIDIVYHPSLPSVGWSKVKITFISNIPILDGYEVVSEIAQ